MIHYLTLGHNSTTLETLFVYVSPVFGKSNTDQSFYEPSSSRIANSVSSVKSDDTKEVSESDAWNIPIFPNGATREELSQMANNEQNKFDSAVKNAEDSSKSEHLIDSISTFMDSVTTTQDTSSQE